jgi:hypothetical protein
MSIEYTWSIPTVERNLADGGVTVAHWRCNAVDGEYSASSYGSCGLKYDAGADNFIAYESLTEENVIAWVKAIVESSNIEASLAANIEEDKTPTTGAGIPW